MSEVKLTPYGEALKLGKEKLELLKIPFRVKRAQKQAELAKLELEEGLAGLEAALVEMCSAENLQFRDIILQQNAIDLQRRTISQYDTILDEMFPSR